MPRAASTPLTVAFLEETVTIRGVPFLLRELSIGDYDELVKKATRSTTNEVTGEVDESVDNALLLKLMVLRCSVEPKLTPEMLAGLPMRATLKLNQTVNRMHYGDEPETVQDADASGEEPAKGED